MMYLEKKKLSGAIRRMVVSGQKRSRGFFSESQCRRGVSWTRMIPLEGAKSEWVWNIFWK